MRRRIRASARHVPPNTVVRFRSFRFSSTASPQIWAYSRPASRCRFTVSLRTWRNARCLLPQDARRLGSRTPSCRNRCTNPSVSAELTPSVAPNTRRAGTAVLVARGLVKGHRKGENPVRGRQRRRTFAPKVSVELPVADGPLAELRLRRSRLPQQVRDALLDLLSQGLRTGSTENTDINFRKIVGIKVFPMSSPAKDTPGWPFGDPPPEVVPRKQWGRPSALVQRQLIRASQIAAGTPARIELRAVFESLSWGPAGHHPLGLEMARRITDMLVSQGVTVVSGMALGIDTVAHQTAMTRGGWYRGRRVGLRGSPSRRNCGVGRC